MSIYDDLNPDWEAPPDLPGWEPWMDYAEDDDRGTVGCEYCGNPEVRDTPEPYGGKRCCEVCFRLLTGDGDQDIDPDEFFAKRGPRILGRPA